MRSALFYGDTHYPFQSDAALRVLYSLTKKLQPDVIIHCGDLVDCWQISQFDKDPQRKSSLQDDIDEAVPHLKTMRQVAPKAACYLLEGNHETRLRRTIWRMNENQRELARLRAFQRAVTWQNLLELGENGWKFVPAEGQAKARILPKLIVKHGTTVKKWSGQTAKAEWERYGKSGLSGHTHRLGVFYTNDFNGSHVWAESGCTCALTPEYVEDPSWQQGVLVVTYVGDRFNVEPVYIQQGIGVFRGQGVRA